MSIEILKKINSSSDEELDTIIGNLSGNVKESKELETLGYDIDKMKAGVENYNKELERYLIDQEVQYKFPFEPGTTEFANIEFPEEKKYEAIGDFKPSKSTSLQLLGLNAEETDDLANFAYNLMYGASSQMPRDTTKEYVGNVIQYFNPDSSIEMAYANELQPETLKDINRIQELDDLGYNLNVNDDLLLYRTDGGNWSVVNAPGMSKGDIGYFGKDIASILLEIPAYAGGGAVGAGIAAGVVESSAQLLAWYTNAKLSGQEPTAEEGVQVFIDSLPDAAITGVSTAVLTKLGDKVFRWVLSKAGKKTLPEGEIEDSAAAIAAGQTNVDKLNKINQEIQETTKDSSKGVQLTLGEATGGYEQIIKENTISKIPELAPKYNQAYKNKINKSQDALETYSKTLFDTDVAPRTAVVSEMGQDIQKGLTEGVEKDVQRILDSYTTDFASVTKIYDLVSKTTGQASDLLDDFGFIQKVFQDQNKIIQGELKTIEDSVSNILNKYGPEVTDNLVKLSTFQKTLKQIDANRSFLNKLEPGTNEHTLFKNFLEFTKDGRKVKNLTLQETQQLIQYIDALSGDAFSSALKGVPDAKKGEFKQLLFALRTDLKRSLKKNLKGDADAIFDAYENMKNIRRDFDNNVVNQLFQKSNSGKLKLSDGNIINHVLSDPRFSGEMASILDQTPNFAKKAAFEQSIIDDYYKNVLNDMSLSPNEIAKKAEAWLKNNKYVDNFFTGENRNILKQMKSPLKFKQLVEANKKASDRALQKVQREFEGIMGLDPANYLDFFQKNPTSFNRVINLIRTADAGLARNIEKQTKEFFLKQFFESTSAYDSRAGMYAFNGEKLKEFLNVNNNKEMLKNIFGTQKADKFINTFSDIADLLNTFQKKIVDAEKEPVIARSIQNLFLGQLDRKRTIIRGIKQSAKLLGAEEYLDNVLDFEKYAKLLGEQEFLNPRATVVAAQYVEAEEPAEDSMIDKITEGIISKGGEYVNP